MAKPHDAPAESDQGPKRPRVLHIITRLDPGGSTTNTLTCVDLLRKHGFQTAVAYGRTCDADGALGRFMSERSIKSFLIPDLVREIEPLKDLSALRALLRLVRAERPDLIHTHSSKAGVLGRLAARMAGVPCVHTPHGHVFYGYFGRFRTRFYVAIERALAHSAARIVSLTDKETEESLARGIGRPEQYVTVPSGVPLAQFRAIPPELGIEFRTRYAVPSSAMLFVSVGRLVPIKGFDLLLKAFACVPVSPNCGPFLALVGDGEERAALETQAVRLGTAERVRFAGELRDVRGALAAADVFVLASRNEGMGRAFIEAMAAGVPVIGTAVGGVPTIIRDGHNGLLAPAANPDALSNAMAKLAADKELRKTMGRNAAGFVYPKFDEQTMIEKLAEIYSQTLAEARCA